MKRQTAIPCVLLCIFVAACLVAPVAGGLTVTPDLNIFTRTGANSTVITVTDTDIPMDANITIDISYLAQYVANYTITNANVLVSDTAVGAIWTRQVEFDGTSLYTLNLTSTNNATVAGETVTVTFTGAAGGNSAWMTDTYGTVYETDLTATRSDTLEPSGLNIFLIETTPGSGGLMVAPGATITTPTGNTSMVINITGEPILQHDLITITAFSANPYVAGGTITDSNVVISDDAAAATWTGLVDGSGMLTLTSDGGDTAIGENVTVNFTGTGPNPWNEGSVGNPSLTITRLDTNAYTDFIFAIDIPPPTGYTVVANFAASPTADIAPLTVTFTDTSAGHPDSWDWDWGDGTAHGATKNPSHTYTDVGTYAVSLTAANIYTLDTKIQYQYIKALNGGINQTNTLINGLTITNCAGQQNISVDTSVPGLSADLIPDKYVLEIQPPADRGLKNITIHAQNGIGFTRNANWINGSPTSVHLVSEDIAPPAGFSNYIGTGSSFNYSIDLPSYPCNAVLSTKIWEGEIPEYNTKLQKIASGNLPIAVPYGTAYTAKITKTNFPSSAPVKLHMSVNSSWNTIDGPLSGGPGPILIWRIADDGNSGQIFPTTNLYTDPVNKLDHFTADSPLGMSTFGISAFTGNNNPFQLVTFAIAQIISPPNEPVVDDPGSPAAIAAAAKANVPAPVPKENPPKAIIPEDPGKTEKIYANANGVITQPTLLESTDHHAQISLGLGVVAKDSLGAPLSSVTVTSLPAGNLPSAPAPASFTFAGMAYTFGPEGATFSPAISLTFNYPGANWAEEYSVKEFDSKSGTWQDLPTTHDPNTGMITAQISHFCCIALFAKSTAPSHAGAVTTPLVQVTPKAPSPPAPTAISNIIGMVWWIANLMAKNILVIVGIIILVVAIFFYGRKRRRDKVMHLL